MLPKCSLYLLKHVWLTLKLSPIKMKTKPVDALKNKSKSSGKRRQGLPSLGRSLWLGLSWQVARLWVSYDMVTNGWFYVNLVENNFAVPLFTLKLLKPDLIVFGHQDCQCTKIITKSICILVKHYNSSSSEHIKKLRFSYWLRHIFALVSFGRSEIVFL